MDTCAEGAESKYMQNRARHARLWRKYLRLTRGGVLTLRALEVVREEEPDEEFKEVISTIRAEIESGQIMSQALEKLCPEFSLSEIELIKAAEKRGAWDEVLQELADGLLDGTF
jgi:type II secretory pathway component PulF